MPFFLKQTRAGTNKPLKLEQGNEYMSLHEWVCECVCEWVSQQPRIHLLQSLIRVYTHTHTLQWCACVTHTHTLTHILTHSCTHILTDTHTFTHTRTLTCYVIMLALRWAINDRFIERQSGKCALVIRVENTCLWAYHLQWEIMIIVMVAMWYVVLSDHFVLRCFFDPSAVVFKLLPDWVQD